MIGSGAIGAAKQGVSVAISYDGNTVIVGGNADNSNAGAAWIFTRTAGVWTQEGSKLVGSGATGAAQQGISVALSADGNAAIVGGNADSGNAGAAWVWTRNASVWTQQGAKLVGSGAVGSARQGTSVSLAGDGATALIGGSADASSAGAAWAWTSTGGVWTQQGAKLVGSDSVGNASQGQSVKLSGDGSTAILGGFLDNSSAGAAWVFSRSGGVWTQRRAKLVGSGGVGTGFQGITVSLSSDGNTAAVGGNRDNGNTGAVWTRTRSGTTWTQLQAKLVGSGAVGNAVQGLTALSADGGTLIEGGSQDDGVVGAAWVFFRDLSGVSAATEDAAPNGGDGNADGVQDSTQPNVVSLPPFAGGGYATLVSPAGTTLVDVSASGNPSPADSIPGVEFPFGFFAFTISGVVPGQSSSVTLLLPVNAGITSYYKYGATPDNTAPHWYAFDYDGRTGAEIFHEPSRTRIVLHFVDGERGDDDVTANGSIVDIGGPATIVAVAAITPIPSLSELALAGLAAGMMIIGYLTLAHRT